MAELVRQRTFIRSFEREFPQISYKSCLHESCIPVARNFLPVTLQYILKSVISYSGNVSLMSLQL